MKRTNILDIIVRAALCAAAVWGGGLLAQEVEENNPFNSVVQLDVVTSAYDVRSPWRKNVGAGSGSGVVIGEGRILTCAHCAADATHIRVRKHTEETTYWGRVEFVSHDCDLALVKVEEAAFMRDVTPCEIGATPRVQSRVLAVGFPMGGDGISYTQGIVSRVEDIEYAHSMTRHLAIQVDAAINPGNSGGPVFDMIDWRVAGIAFQGNKAGESLGYIIPPDVVRHFLRDVEDGQVDGFGFMQFSVAPLEHKEARRYLKMSEGQTGCLVEDVSPSLGGDSLKRGDVLLEVCGYQVANNGMVRLVDGERRLFRWLLDQLQIGESYPVKVLRDGKEMSFTLVTQPRNMRSLPLMYDKQPDYYVFGGFVFTPVSFSYLALQPLFKFDQLYAEKESPDDIPVALVDVMADEATEGYLSYGGSLVRKLNGVEVRNIHQLIEMLESSQDEFLKFEVDNGNTFLDSIIINREQQQNATVRILEKYAIPADRSAALR